MGSRGLQIVLVLYKRILKSIYETVLLKYLIQNDIKIQLDRF